MDSKGFSMNVWDKGRLPCLFVVLAGSLAALGWGINTPLQPRPTVAAFSFPAIVPLTGWQQLGSSPLPIPTYEKLIPIASKVYQYRQDGRVLEIEMRYLTATKGDIPQFLHWYKSIEQTPAAKIERQPGIGYHLFFVHQNKAYLSSCIHPQGESTVDGKQYLKTKLLSSGNPRQLWGWLVGQKTLFDQRCLWSHLSLPLTEPSQPEKTHQILKEVWLPWADWWQKNFPEP
jgi:cyanosortase A-associated protein